MIIIIDENAHARVTCSNNADCLHVRVKEKKGKKIMVRQKARLIVLGK
jgi:hypothetical protein